MRFFLFFILFYFSNMYSVIFFNNFYDLKRDNVLFSNNIRINIDKLPYRNYQIIKKFDIVNFNFKQKTKITNNFITSSTDSKTDNVKLKENITIENLPPLKEVSDNIFNNNQLLKKNKSTYSSKNIRLIADNLEDNNNKEPSVDLNILETVSKAINYNPKIKSQKLSYKSTKENIKQVYSGILPSIEMNLSKGYKDIDSKSTVTKLNENLSPQDFSINLEQNLYTGGKLTSEINKAKSKLLIEEENLRLTHYETILESALVYLDVL